MKKIFQALIIAALLISMGGAADALTLKAERAGFEKGGTLNFSGTCDSGTVNSIKGETGRAKIFDEQLNCFDGKFDYSYLTNFNDPSGNWKITLYTPESETTAQVRVNLTPESAYYRVTFLSPAGFSFMRGQNVFVSVELTDSGTPVDGAKTGMFDVAGERISLKGEGGGIYDVNYVIPFDAGLGEWLLTVTAEKNDGGNVFGGEREIETEITQADFAFSIIEPSQKTYEQSDTIPFKAGIFYPGGRRLEKSGAEKVQLIAGDEKLDFEQNSEGEFILAYTPKKSGSQEMGIYVKDSAGNTSEEKISLVVSCSITCFLKLYGLAILVIILVAGVVLRLFYGRIRLSLELAGLKNEKQKTWQLIKDLQSEYFGKGVMPSSSYRSNLTSYKARVMELEEKIKEIEKKLQEGK